VSSNVILFPSGLAPQQERRVALLLQLIDGSELKGQVSLKGGQTPQALLQDDRGFIPLQRSDGITHMISTELVDGICLLSSNNEPFPAA
jgi:hypothetical protein